MAAPIYSQEEADALIMMPKRITVGAWENRKSGRPSAYEESYELNVIPENDSTNRLEFRVEQRVNTLTDAISYTLKGRIERRPFEGLCRYDIHDGLHSNPEWFPPPIIEAGAFHRHVYNQQAVREFDRWDKCAQLLKLSSDGSPEQLKTRLFWCFIDELKIRFSESDTLYSLREAAKNERS